MEKSALQDVMEAGERLRAAFGELPLVDFAQAVRGLEHSSQSLARAMAADMEAHLDAWGRLATNGVVHFGELLAAQAFRELVAQPMPTRPPHPKRQARARGGELAAWRAQQRQGARNVRP